MFKKVISYPNGDIEVHYNDEIVTENKYGLPIRRIRTSKELNGHLELCRDIRTNSRSRIAH